MCVHKGLRKICVMLLAVGVIAIAFADSVYAYFTGYDEKNYVIESGVSLALESGEGIENVIQEGYRDFRADKGWYKKGEQAELIAVVGTEYIFDGWYLGEELLSTEQSFTYQIETSANIEAKAVKIPLMMSGPAFQNPGISGISETIKQQISEIAFVNVIPEEKTQESDQENIWDVSHLQDGSVMAWLEDTKLYIGGEGGVYLNPDASKLFAAVVTGDAGKETMAFSKVEKISFDKNVNTSKTQNMSQMFYKSKAFSLAVEEFDVSNVTNMSSMFRECVNVISLDVASWDTGNVEDMNGMFSGTTKNTPMSLEALDVSAWNMSNVKYPYDMFEHCQKLTTLDVSEWDTSSFEDTSYMFNGCINMSELDVSDWDVSKVKNMRCMFQLENKANMGRPPIKVLDVSKWDTSSCENMSYMFYGCAHVEVLEVSNWDISKNKDFNHIFCDNYSLKELDLSKWDTSNVENFNAMFNNCNSLTVLDVSNFNTSNATIFSQMFEDCPKLERIIGLENFDTSKATTMAQMFRLCISLTELNLSSFDTSKVHEGNPKSDADGFDKFLLNTPSLSKIILGEKFSFAGDGTCLASKQVWPDAQIWYSISDGKSYAPYEIPNNVADTYVTSRVDNE